MANNRMMLRCKNCKEVFMIGKYYPVSWAWPIDSDEFGDWLTQHDDENHKVYEATGRKYELGMDAEFYDLVYENGKEDYIWPHLKKATPKSKMDGER